MKLTTTLVVLLVVVAVAMIILARRPVSAGQLPPVPPVVGQPTRLEPPPAPPQIAAPNRPGTPFTGDIYERFGWKKPLPIKTVLA